MTESPPPWPTRNPPPLTVAASLAAVQGSVILLLAVLELADLTGGRIAMGLSTAAFFAAYGVVLLAAAWGLWSRRSWARGPVLITQLLFLGLAWNLRTHEPVAVTLLVTAVVVLAGTLHPDSVEALDRDQSADSSD